MKKNFYFLVAAFFLISTSLFAQERTCASAEYLEQQLQNNPRHAENLAKLEALTQQRADNSSLQRTGNILYVPVVVHVVYNTDEQNISDEQIQSQIDVIYKDFRGLNSEFQNIQDNLWPQAADMEIEFYLAQIDPDGNPTNGITRTQTDVTGWDFGDGMKSSATGGQDPWDTSKYFNFWTVNFNGGLLGFAQFPGGAPETDGIVMGAQFFGTSDDDVNDDFYLQAPFDRGRTTTHEMGHFFNLRHIWGDGGCGVDDFVADTPESGGSNFGCAVGVESCGSVDMVENYMDYSDDACMGLFTEGQKNRMRATLEPGGPRAELNQSPFPFLLSVNEGGQPTDVCTTETAVIELTYSLVDPEFTDEVDFSLVSGLPTGATAVFSPTSATAEGTPVTLTISNLSAVDAGPYTIAIQSTDGTEEVPTTVTLNVFSSTFEALTATSPVDGAVDENPTATLIWSDDVNAAAYEIDVASDAGFTNIIASGVPETNEFEASLMNETQYFWRVRAVNQCGEGDYVTASFTTGNITCSNSNSTDTPLDIPDGIFFVGPGDPVLSELQVLAVSEISDVNVTIDITHTWNSDLTIILTSPSGTDVVLSANNGGTSDNFTNTVFDSDATDPISGGTGPFTGTFSPDGDLATLIGEVSSGVWVLSAQDAASGDVGIINSWSIEICGIPLPDADGDGVPDPIDNCPDLANTDQADIDGDGIGDICDDDIDGDGVLNDADNCPETANADQADLDNNGIGEACDVICDAGVSEDTPILMPEDLPDGQPFVVISEIFIEDNFIVSDINVTIDIAHTFNSDLRIVLIEPSGQDFILLSEQNGGGTDNFTNTVFDDQADIAIGSGAAPYTGSFIPDEPLATFNGLQSRGTWSLGVVDFFEGDGGALNSWSIDVCGTRDLNDYDGDGATNDVDNCLFTFNEDQADNDGDGIGDFCDDDDDNDGVLDVNDNCQFEVNPNQADNDGDGLGDVCDDDDDNDGVLDDVDNCQFTANSDQADIDFDGVGDACDGLTANDVLTPNGDGVNDTWTIINIERFPGTVVRVFNRWGNEVFRTNSYTNDWRGTNESGKTLPSGSYYYQLDQSGEGTTIVSGWILITI